MKEILFQSKAEMLERRRIESRGRTTYSFTRLQLGCWKKIGEDIRASSFYMRELIDIRKEM